MNNPPKASLLGLPGELRNQIYGYVAADVDRIYTCPGIETPRIFGSADVAPGADSRHTIATVTESDVVFYSDRTTRNCDPHRIKMQRLEQPGPEPISSRHPLLQTCRQLRDEFLGIFQSPAICPREVDIVIEDFDFTQLLHHLGHTGDVNDKEGQSGRLSSCTINICLRRSSCSFEQIARNLKTFAHHFLRSDPVIDITIPSWTTPRFSFTQHGITYTVHFKSMLRWKEVGEYINSFKSITRMRHDLLQAFITEDFFDSPAFSWFVDKHVLDLFEQHLDAAIDFMYEYKEVNTDRCKDVEAMDVDGVERGQSWIVDIGEYWGEIERPDRDDRRQECKRSLDEVEEMPDIRVSSTRWQQYSRMIAVPVTKLQKEYNAIVEAMARLII